MRANLIWFFSSFALVQCSFRSSKQLYQYQYVAVLNTIVWWHIFIFVLRRRKKQFSPFFFLVSIGCLVIVIFAGSLFVYNTSLGRDLSMIWREQKEEHINLCWLNGLIWYGMSTQLENMEETSHRKKRLWSDALS